MSLEDKKWNGNAFNNTGEEQFIYTGVGEAFSMRDTTFTNTAKVVQYYETNAIEQDDRQEVYAYGVGMIFKRTLDFEYCRR